MLELDDREVLGEMIACAEAFDIVVDAGLVVAFGITGPDFPAICHEPWW